MQAASILSKIFIWITVLIAALFQSLAMWGIHLYNTNVIALGNPENQYNILPLLLATVGLVVAALLFTFLPQRLRFIGLILLGIVALVFIPIALDLGRQFPPFIGGDGEDHGLTTWAVVSRHMLPVLTAVLALGAWVCDRAQERQVQLRLRDEAKREHFDLSGAPLFTDRDKPRREIPAAGEKKRPH